MMDGREPAADQASDDVEERRARLYRVRGIVLRRRDLGEADRIITIFTAEQGKRRIVAKGTRRTSSKMAGHLEPFCATRLLVARTRGLDIISQAETIEHFSDLRLNEAAIATAGYFAELVDALLPEDQAQEPIYELMYASLRLLNEGRDTRLVTHIFEMGMLRQLGYRPELARCVTCGAEIEPVLNGFSLDGGVICPGCLRVRPDVPALSVNALKLLRAIDRGDIEQLFWLRLPPSIWSEVGDLLTRYIERVTGRESSALRVLESLRLE
ncbi:MAG: DNA repair protein RecO [Thermomicrobiales bacterium]